MRASRLLIGIVIFSLLAMPASSAQTARGPNYVAMGPLDPAHEVTCTKLGSMELNDNGQATNATYFNCGAAGNQNWQATLKSLEPHLDSQDYKSNPSSSTQNDPSSNLNYDMVWSSGPCNSSCTDSNIIEQSLFTPNTLWWGIQDNAYGGGGICGTTLDYQIAPTIGTSGNNYQNWFYVGYVDYGFMCLTSEGYVYAPVLQGTNMNTGSYSFEEFYGLSSSGYAITGDLIVRGPGIDNFYNVGMPSGGNNIPINGWEIIVVCARSAGCTTNFGSGSGTILYLQNNIQINGPNTQNLSSEKSNCNYNGATNHGTYASQGFSC